MNTYSAANSIQFFACGDTALTIEFSDLPSADALDAVQAAYHLVSKASLRGVKEFVPAFTTLTIIFDPLEFESAAKPHEILTEEILVVLNNAEKTSLQKNILPLRHNTWNIPVCYDGEYAPDLDELASMRSLSKKDIVRLHTAAEYRIAMIGFTPGFPYLLGLPKELASLRKSTPRARVEAGSVGIAGEQTGIYPSATPGGWNIIGRTPLKIFSMEKEPPMLFQTGDIVRFYAISKEEFFEIEKAENSNAPQKKDSLSTKNSAVTIVESRFGTTVQDLGRKSNRRFGIPKSGAADAVSLAFANALVGNVSNEAALEILWGGLTVKFEQDTVCAFTGAEVLIESCFEGGSWSRAPMNLPVLFRQGSVVRMDSASRGVYAYCAVQGGISVPKVFGSRSTYTQAGFGGLEGRYLQAADVLEVGVRDEGFEEAEREMLVESRFEAARKRTFAFKQLFPKEKNNHRSDLAGDAFIPLLPYSLHLPESNVRCDVGGVLRVRVLKGREWENLSEVSRNAVWSEQWRVLPHSNKMGIRLEAASKLTLESVSKEQVVSRAVMPGAVQLPPNGQPIVLGSDAQTTGGYPVILHICTEDLPKMAQLRPFQEIHFEEISLETAQKLYIENAKTMELLERRTLTWLRAHGLP